MRNGRMARSFTSFMMLMRWCSQCRLVVALRATFATFGGKGGNGSGADDIGRGHNSKGDDIRKGVFLLAGNLKDVLYALINNKTLDFDNCTPSTI